MVKRVITYGTFDLFHIGHLHIIARAAALGDELIVGVSTDEFNLLKGKKSVIPYMERALIVSALKNVTHVIPEKNWDQKPDDIKKYGISTFVMGDDWKGKFDHLSELCEVVYLPRTPDVSTTEVIASIQKMLKKS